MSAKGDQSCRPSALLGFALTLLKTPGRWAPGNLAVDGKGVKVRPSDPSAARWDSTGALLRAWSVLYSPKDAAPFLAALACLRQAVGAGDRNAELFRWEDRPERTHPDIMAAFQRAIILAYQRPGGTTPEPSAAA